MAARAGLTSSVHLVASLFGLGIPDGALRFVGAAFGGGHQHFVIFDPRIGEERLQPVVILLQNRVEFVIVAAGAAKGQAQEGWRDRIGNVVQDFLAALQ